MWPCPLISKTSDSVVWVAIYRVSLQLPTQAKYNSFDSQACIMSPFTILYTRQTGTLNMVANRSVYDISGKDCYLTNCINSSTNPKAFLLFCRPSHILLPVNLSSPWYEDSVIFASQHGANALSDPKRFIAELILGITARIAIVGSVAVSTTALIQQIYTANHVNTLSKKVSMAQVTQEGID